MNAAKLFNIVLNLGGIVVSIIGIFCVAKIAFVRQWQVQQFDSEVAELGKVEELQPVSGKAIDPQLAMDARIDDFKGAIAELKREDDARLAKSTSKGFSPRPFSPPQPAKKIASDSKPKTTEDALKKEVELSTTTQKQIESAQTRIVPIGLNRLDSTLGTSIAKGYLEHLGFRTPKTETNGSNHRVSGSGTFGESQLSVSLQWDTKADNTNSKQHRFASQSVSVVVNRDNPIDHLTTKQLADITSGRVTQWKTVGGEASAIDIVAVGKPQSDLVNLIEKTVLHRKDYDLKADKFDFLQIEDAHNNVSAGRAVLAFIPTELVDHNRVKTLAISADSNTRRVLPNSVTINALDYPLARHLYLDLPEKMNKFTQGLIEFIDSEKGQKLGSERGYTMQNTELTKQNFDLYQQHIQSLNDDKRILPAYQKLIAEGDRLNSQTNLSFNYGEMALTDESQKDLAALANWLIREQIQYQVVLLGFADAVGRYADNKELSIKRAQVAAEYLKGRGFENTKTIGFGEEMPIGDNSLEKGRARNRRVEIWIVRPMPEAPPK